MFLNQLKLQRRLNFPFCSWEDMQVCRSVSSQAKTMSHSQFESRGCRRVHWDPFLSRGTMQRVLSAVKLLSEPNKGANCQCCRLDPCTLLWWWHLYLCLCQTKLCHWLLVALPHFLQSEIMIHSKHGGIKTCCILTLQQITHRQTTCWMMSITGI